MNNNNLIVVLFIILFTSGCSTYKLQYTDKDYVISTSNQLFNETEKEIEKSFYLIGDAGNANLGESTSALKALKKYIGKTDTKDDYVIFLGDNIYEKGLPVKGDENRKLAEHRMVVQVDAVKEFKGNVVFIPGNHDWYGDGLKGLKRQEDFVEKALKDKNAFQPEKGCPIKKIDVTDNIVLLVIDTQWYIVDWDKHPTINDNCDIKTQYDFYIEIENLLKKNNEKTVIIAMHHPAYTNGIHGGMFNFEKHIFPTQGKVPLPFIGSIIAQLRSTGGVSPQDRSNNKYDELIKRLTTYTKGNERVIFVSGHEHNLQYIEKDGIKQIISGAGSKSSAVTLGNDGLFSYGGQGFAVLDIFTDGSSEVSYFSAENDEPKLIYNISVYKTPKTFDTSKLASEFDSRKKVSIYKKEDTQKSNSYTWFWGDHYRYIYGMDIDVPVATLDTLYGGLKYVRKGGAHQTRSIRLINNEGKIYAIRAVKKSAVQFLQSVAFKKVYVKDELRETLTEDLVLDFYTSGHPFANLTIPDLSDAIGLYHTNPELFYIPKHPDLGKYNEDYGDELYIIEERPDDTFLDVESFGNPDAIESTYDVLENLRKDEKYGVDEPGFIKARLFDMLIGDWDRHYDQWRWSRFNISDDEVLYRPIPRDRDQAFSNYDGALFDVLKVLMPGTRQFQVFNEEIKDIDWINLAGIKIDRAFIQKSSKEVWLEQAKYIQENLTDEVIDIAFSKLPEELQDDTTFGIKENLKSRRADLVEIASRYYEFLSELVIITATDKEDYIEITRHDNSTKISLSRIKKGKVQKPYKERIVFSDETKEIWVYGLDDDDQFVVNGEGKNPVFVRIIGGQNNDVYTIENGRRVKVYDHKSKPNTIKKKGSAIFKFQDIYANNVYDYTKRISKVNTIVPLIGSNPDDGFKISISDTYLVNGFKNDPFQHKHTIKVEYYFATDGFDIKYKGTFAHTFGIWNLIIGGQFTSANYTQNFFGFGNETENLDDELGLDYNRVKTAGNKVFLGISKIGHFGSSIEITVAIEDAEVDDTEGRFIHEFFIKNPGYFDENMIYTNLDFIYTYSSYDLEVNPSRGMNFIYKTGIKNNIDDFGKSYGYIHPRIEFFNSISHNRKLVLKTMVQGQFNIGDDFEFYQAAKLGADTGLRGYRKERFSGKSALAFGGDLRYSFNSFRTRILPLQIGIFGGYDIGRVWVKEDSSKIWHDDYGGGLWLNAVDTISGQFGLFTSDEGVRFTFGFGISI